MASLVALGNQPVFSPAILEEKEAHLLAILRELRPVMVAYSGGTDSAYPAWAAHRALRDGALAITAESASLPDSHKRDAIALVRQYCIPHELFATFHFQNPAYT